MIRERLAVDTLLSLSTEQIERLGHFLASPYFKIKPETQNLFQWLCDRGLDQLDAVSDEEVFADLVPGVPYDPQHLNRLFFQLMGAIMEFLSVEQFQRAPEAMRNSALEELLTWHLDHAYRRKHKSIKKELDARGGFSEAYLRQRVSYLRGHLEFLYRESQMPAVMESLAQAYQDQGDLHLLISLKLYAAMLNRELLSTDKIPTDLVPPDIPKDKAQNGSLSQMYIAVIDCWSATLANQEKEAFDAYQRLKKLLATHEKALLPEEALDLYHYCINFCNYTLRSGTLTDQDLDPLEDIYAWYLKVMNHVLKLGRVDWRVVYNYITLLLRRKMYRKAEDILKKVEGKLVGDSADHPFIYMKGLIAFHRKDFRAALRCFIPLLGENKRTLVNIHGRTMLLHCKYELKDPDMEQDSESFRQFLRRSVGKRSGLSQDKLALYINFNKILIALVKIRDTPAHLRTKKRLENVMKKIDELELVCADWLQEKAAELGA